MIGIIVTKSCSQIRAEARDSLRGNWKTAVLVALVYLVVLNAPAYIVKNFLNEGAIGVFGLIFSIVIGGPLAYGLSLFVLKLTRRQEGEISDLFEGFNVFGSAVLLSFLITLFIILWSLLFLIPGIIAMLRYSQAYFILIDNPNMSPGEAIDKSKQMMRGNKGKLFLLGISFIGWILLTIFTFGIGGLWLTPYMYTSLAVFYKELSEEAQINIEGTPKDNTHIQANDLNENE